MGSPVKVEFKVRLRKDGWEFSLCAAAERTVLGWGVGTVKCQAGRDQFG